ncbi:MAG TPA: transferrin-binding protein-like solute binding protein [Rhizomicrobium sp.]|nr:transferrin-binding protein-like solute binding protein [Rhizomicrobium sp.]
MDKPCLKLALMLCVVLPLAACSSGGGGGMPAAPATPSNVSISAPVVNIPSTNPITIATGASPNFTTSLPAVGTVFPMDNAEINLTSTSVGPETDQGPQLIYEGTQTVNGNTFFTFRISDGALSPGDVVIPANGSSVTSISGQYTLALDNLNYLVAGIWAHIPPPGNATLGTFTAGYQTPAANVPTSGTGTYIGSGASVGSPTAGGAVGTVFAPSGTGTIAAAGIVGQANITVNFGSGALTGSLTNMTATPTSGGSATPWNNVTLTGSVSGTSTPFGTVSTISGSTSTSGASGSFGLSSAATGNFAGALYGPNGQELGAIWTLAEPSAVNGKAAIGVIGATKQ